MDARNFYAAKCYWPDGSEAEVANATRRAVVESSSTGASATECLGALLFPHDGLVLCVFRAASPGAVRRASERAGLPCERVMQAVWLSGHINEEQKR